MTQTFEEALIETKKLIQEEYKNYLPETQLQSPFKGDMLPNYRKENESFWSMVSDYPARAGKNIRGGLILLTCQAMGGDPEKTIKTATAMQASQDWILIHDDIEDQSEERRSKPTLHKIHGEALALNAGDALHVIMNKILQDNFDVLTPQKAMKVMREFNDILMRTVFGQHVEIEWIKNNRLDLSYDDVMFVISGKTCYYTIAGPMRLGAIIAGATHEQLDVITEFGSQLGLAFQIRDDILDLTSDFEGQKKQIGNDIYEGKRTIMLVHLLKTLDKESDEYKKLVSLLQAGRTKMNAEDVNWVIRQMKINGSFIFAENIADEAAKRAYALFNRKMTFLKNDESKKLLEQGIHYILNRKK